MMVSFAADLQKELHEKDLEANFGSFSKVRRALNEKRKARGFFVPGKGPQPQQPPPMANLGPSNGMMPPQKQ